MVPNLDAKTSATIAKRVGARFRYCWTNAARSACYLGKRTSYVEGWVIVHPADPFVIEHGWCETNGRIIDPTYTPTVSLLEPPLAYFAGIRLTQAETYAALQQRHFPVAWQAETQAYLKAFEAALRATAKLHPAERRPPTRVVNCRREPYDIFIGRPSKWGNPFRIGPDGDRSEVIGRYRQWVIRQPSLLRDLHRLRGKALGCHCAPTQCHGDILAELADFGHEHEPAPQPRAG